MQNTELAPVILFTYKRLDTLQQTVNALRKNYLAEDSRLFIYSDAAKHETDAPLIASVRDYLKTIDGFNQVTIIEAPRNKGLANSIISGVSEVIEKYDRAIVLEDDLISTPNFLCFMNKALRHYSNSPSVFSISGYSFDLANSFPGNSDAYFLNRGWSWGWATWIDRWRKVDWQVSDYAAFLKDKASRKAFSKGGSDLNRMLRQQMEGKLDSWAIRWFYHQFRTGGLTLYPVTSKIDNKGFDAYATHTVGSNKRYKPLIDCSQKTEFSFPDTIKTHPIYYKEFIRRMGVSARLKSKLEGILLKLF
ncbi:glycosyltransferase [Pontibacter ruber]|uniref:Glycosyltransferase n=1 Tax=Pontibacter ruber TaxID=1343895 RepID=A0ABW5CRV0_9BACT|nr:glycosyltransferase [Pontibacter ruber]